MPSRLSHKLMPCCLFLFLEEPVPAFALPVILPSDTHFIPTALSVFPPLLVGETPTRIPCCCHLAHVLQNNLVSEQFSTRDALRLSPDALSRTAALPLSSVWFALEDFGHHLPEHWATAPKVRTANRWLYRRSDCQVIPAAGGSGSGWWKVSSFQSHAESLPCRAASQAQELRAPQFCYEMCGKLSSDNC